MPKVFTPKSTDEFRNIIGLLTLNNITEKIVSELGISDMSKCLGWQQCKINHGVIATLYDWKVVFQCHCP